MAIQPLKDQPGYEYNHIVTLDGGLDLSGSSDIIDENRLSVANNVRVHKNEVISDTGYIDFLDPVRGNARLEYQFKTSTGSIEDLLITDETFYRKLDEQWQYVSNGTDSTSDGGEPSGEDEILVVDATGFADNDYIGIELDDGTQHQTRVNGAPAANVITVDDPIPVGRTVSNGALVVKALVLTGNNTRQVSAVTVAANDVVIFTNGVNIVKVYDGTTVGDVPNLPSAGNTICMAVGVFENYVLLINTTEGGSAFPQRIRWSDTADYTEWVTGNAGFEDKVDNPNPFIGGDNLGPYFIAYKDEFIVRIEFVGTEDTLFNIETIVSGQGLRSTNGICRISKTQHAVLGIDTVYLYSGGFDYQSISSDIDDNIFGRSGELAPASSHLCLITFVRELDELFVFYVTTSATEYCDKMVRYNFKKGCWTSRNFLNEISGLGFIIASSSTPWSSLVGTWSQQTWKWGSAIVAANSAILQLCSLTQVYSYNYLAIQDDGQDIPWLFTTGVFTSPYYEFRHDIFEIMARGSTLTVEYSKDLGETWDTLKVFSLTSAFKKYRATAQFVAQTIMYRFSGTGPGFSLRWIGFKFIDETAQKATA